MVEPNIILDELLDEMMLTSFIESIHYSNKLEDINVPLDRCRELVIGTYDCND
jgi:hypothetical protein